LTDDDVTDVIAAIKPSWNSRVSYLAARPAPACPWSEIMQTADADSISLRQLVGLLWKSKWLLIAITLLTGLLAAVISRPAPTRSRQFVVLSPVSSSPQRAAWVARPSQIRRLLFIPVMSD